MRAGGKKKNRRGVEGFPIEKGPSDDAVSFTGTFFHNFLDTSASLWYHPELSIYSFSEHLPKTTDNSASGGLAEGR
jgi:hypothetical protein